MHFSARRLGLFVCFFLFFMAASMGAQAYTKIVVFGDSLSDTGNIAHLAQEKFGVRLPGPVFGYTDGRFTDGTDTLPPAMLYTGLWIEQMAASLPGKPLIKSSLDGGSDYAYGDATTGNGTTTTSYGNLGLSLTLNNMGQQVTDYLATVPTIDGSTLFVVWGGANDLLSATDAADINTAVTNELTIVQRLIAAGATDILVPNLPALGTVPRLNGMPVAAAQATAASQAFGTALFAGLQSLSSANAGKTLHLFPLDIFTLFNKVIAAPSANGLDDVTATSQFRSVNPDRYFFWDDLHPTTAGHHLIAVAAQALITPVIATTTTMLTSSAIRSDLNANVTLTATVTASAGSPSGSVSFLDGTTTIGTGTLVSTGATTATASLVTAALSAGAHSITATYPATGNFASSTSAVLTVTVTSPSFTSTASPTSLTIARGSTGTSTITITPVGGYTGSIALACGTLPAHMTCTFSSATLSLTGNDTVQTSTLTLGTETMSAAVMPARRKGVRAAEVMCALLLPGWLLLSPVRRRRSTRSLHLLSRCGLAVLGLFALSAFAGLAGCAGNDDRVAAGSYTVPVTVTAGTSSSTINLQVTVQ